MDLLIQEKHRVLHITLNAQSKRNALTAAMCAGIVDAVEQAQHKENIGCILICAAGSVFCSGMDLDEAADPQGPDLQCIHERLFSLGASSLKPIVVSVNGAALGGGLGLAAQGHVVMSSDLAMFGLPEIRIGLWPFFVYRAVEAAIGARRTLELSLTGHFFNPERAQQWGLVHEICPSAELGDRAKVLSRELARSSPVAIEAGMQYVRGSRRKSWTGAGQLAAELRAKLMKSDDFKEGLAAFKEKREPRWPGMPSHFYEKH
ncbi:MAG TPA: enoyl-CoA hydratase/isomerase family protein [Bryobacteraceae bacterium]|nr:enoyl-CoA hydratase/isomerase family protein [Bryobacteraceae bacterium]